MTSKTARYAFSRTIPVMCGYLFLGMAFGLMMQQQGLGWGWSALCSFTVYAGSMQFVLAGLLAAGDGLAAAAVAALLVNGRHIFYGLSLLGRFRSEKKRYPYLVSALTDETYSLLVAGHPADINGPDADFLITLFDHIYWVTGSAVGGLLGQAVPFDLTGIDFSMTALFVSILTEQMRVPENRVSALIGLAAALAALMLLGESSFLLPAMAVIVLATLLRQERGRAA